VRKPARYAPRYADDGCRSIRFDTDFAHPVDDIERLVNDFFFRNHHHFDVLGVAKNRQTQFAPRVFADDAGQFRKRRNMFAIDGKHTIAGKQFPFSRMAR
jgi:hypothetical protein